ncbi:hypothetical protein LCGC14_0686750 [marine sediment metagenome]|uniref:Uncharacterized protein n=1 Tax=marine sediment metagenome TaxID=412755 RepID=A0A0F9TUP0_9ZZZZ
MIEEVTRFKELLGRYLEIDDMQAVDIVIAAAVSHKIPLTEMLWLRIIGASGSGKTELLRTLSSLEGYSTTIESITPGAIRRGYQYKRKGENQRPLLERIDGQLVITKEFAIILTKNNDTQKEIFGLLRGVHDGELDCDYGSEEGHLHQESRFDWILGTTQFIERQRMLETQLGSRFVDLRWGSPIGEERAVEKAANNDGSIKAIRGELNVAMSSIVINTVAYPKPEIEYLSGLAVLAARLRTPVERDTRTGDIYDIPQPELGTRFGMALSRIARGLLMIGIQMDDIKPYMVRMVRDCMTYKRAGVVRAWLKGIERQRDIADSMKLSASYINRTIEDLRLLGVSRESVQILRKKT